MQTIRQIVDVKTGGKIELSAPELIEGMKAEVIVLVDEAPHSEDRALRIQKAVADAQAMVKRNFSEDRMLSDELIQERREASQLD